MTDGGPSSDLRGKKGEGAATTVIACFPFVFTRLLDFVGLYGLLLAPAGAEGVKLDTPVSVPTTYLWGNRDPYLGRVAAEDTARYCTGDYRFVEMDAGHWLPEKRPEAVGAEILNRIS